MQTKNCLSRFRDALTFSALLLALPAICPAHEADRFGLCPSALRAARIGPPPCANEPIPPYPGLDDSANVKSWSESDFGHWRPPACTGWTAVGFTTLVTTVARFRHTSETEGLLRHIRARIPPL